MALYFFIFLCLTLTYPAVRAGKHVQHDVGGSSGWSDKTDFAAWASTQVFTKGDKIVFLYNSQHGVAIVSQEDYDSCNTANPIKSYSNGLTTIKLKKAGPMYFIDPIPGQCQAGMKMTIDIRAKGDKSSRDTPSLPTPDTPSLPIPYTPSFPTPYTPSFPTPDTPSLPTPTTSSMPSGGNPTGTMVPSSCGVGTRILSYSLASVLLVVAVLLMT